MFHSSTNIRCIKTKTFFFSRPRRTCIVHFQVVLLYNFSAVLPDIKLIHVEYYFTFEGLLQIP